MDSDAELGGDQDNSIKYLLASVHKGSGPIIDTKLAGVLENIWSMAKPGDKNTDSRKLSFYGDPFAKS